MEAPSRPRPIFASKTRRAEEGCRVAHCRGRPWILIGSVVTIAWLSEFDAVDWLGYNDVGALRGDKAIVYFPIGLPPFRQGIPEITDAATSEGAFMAHELMDKGSTFFLYRGAIPGVRKIATL